MKRILPLIGFLLLSTFTFGQLSIEHLRENAEQNLIHSGFNIEGNQSSAPYSLSEVQGNIEPNVPLLGIKFGGNMSKVISDSAATNSEYKSGLRGGFLYGVYFSEIFTLETGIMYEGKGFVKTNTARAVQETDTNRLISLTDYDYSARFHYLQIPLYGRLTFGDNVKFYTTFGFHFGIPLTASQEGTMQMKTITQEFSGSIDTIAHPIDTLTGDAEMFTGMDLGGSIGIGFEWPMKVKGFTGPPPSLFVDIKYQRSLVSIGKATEEEITVNGDPVTIEIPAPEAFNQGIAITAGLIFPLSVK